MIPGSMPRPTLRARMFDGTARVFLAEALIVPTGLLTVAYLTRQLGPTEYGRYTLAVALIAWLEWGLAAPFGRAALRLLSATTDWQPVASLVVRSELIAGAVMAVALFLAAPLVAAALDEPALTSLLRLFAIDIPLFGLSHAHQQVLVALGHFRARAWLSFTRWTVRLTLIIGAVEAGLSTQGVVLAIVGTSVVEIALARRFVRPPIFRRSHLPASTLFEYALPLLVTALCLRVFDRVDVVMLKLLGRSAAEVGVYGAAQSLTLAAGLFTTAFAPLLLATVTRAVGSGELSQAREIGRDAMRLVVLLLPLAAILAVSARDVVPLIFGAPYLSGFRIFQFMIVTGLMNAAISIGCALLVAAGKPTLTLKVAVPLPVVAIVAHAWVIPRYGSVGAAEVMLLCAASGAAIAFAAIYSVWHIAPPAASTLRSVVLTVLAAAAAAAWPASGPLVLIKLGTLCLGVALCLVVSGEFGRPQTVVNRARLAFQGDAALDVAPRVE